MLWSNPIPTLDCLPRFLHKIKMNIYLIRTITVLLSLIIKMNYNLHKLVLNFCFIYYMEVNIFQYSFIFLCVYFVEKIIIGGIFTLKLKILYNVDFAKCSSKMLYQLHCHLHMSDISSLSTLGFNLLLC